MATDQQLVQILWELASTPAPQPWCSIHECPPHDCFPIHYPQAFRPQSVPLPETADELKARIAAEHLRRQAETADL